MSEDVKQEKSITTADFVATGDRKSSERNAVEPIARERPIGDQRDQPPTVGGAKMVREESAAPLFAPNAAQDLKSRWDEIQSGFVDEPRRSVEQADSLVAETMKRLAEVFAEERSKLEQQWDRGGDVSTEDLRLTLQRYRSFFTRLLSV